MSNTKKLGTKIDKLYAMKVKLDALSQEVEKHKAKYNEEKLKLMGELNKEGLNKVEGSVAYMTIGTRSVIVVDDWEGVYKYVKKKSAYDLLPKKLNSKAVNERIGNKEKLPFLHTETIRSPLLNKIKRKI